MSKKVSPKTMKQTPREAQIISLSVTTKSALRNCTMEDHLEQLSEAAGPSQITALSAASSQEKCHSQVLVVRLAFND